MAKIALLKVFNQAAVSRWGTVLVGLVALSSVAIGQQQTVAEGKQAIPARLAGQSLLLDIAEVADSRLLVVGERGHVLVSDDQGDSWRQILGIPTRTTLIAVTSHGQRIWAVGHDTTIIASEDNGESWSIQYESIGGDPLMDIAIDQNGDGMAIGAYGVMLLAEDYGQQWTREFMIDLVIHAEATDDLSDVLEQDSETDDDGFLDQDEIADFEDLDVEYHLNSLLRLDAQRLVIAAEAGHGYYTDDNGASWQIFRLPYDGSMFGVLPQADGADCLITFGLRGNILKSCEILSGWESLDSGVNSSLFDAAYDDSGQLWFVGANGTLLRMSANGLIEQVALDTGDDFNGLFISGERLIMIGESGVQTTAMQAGSTAAGTSTAKQ